ncbi:MAG: hypothetical protein ACXVB9_09755 [Bdellovibrionota bacterium]
MRFLLAQNSVLLLGALLLLEPTAAKAAEYCSPEEMSGIAARRAAAARAHDPNPGAVAGRERDVERFLQRATPTPATATIPGITPDLAADLGRLKAETVITTKATPSRAAAEFAAHDAITRDLFNGRITSVRRFSQNDNKHGLYVVQIEAVDHVTGEVRQREAFFKPRTWGDEDGWARAPMEYLAYDLNRKLDMDYVPPTAYRRGLHVEADGQVFTEGAFILKAPEFKALAALPGEKFAAAHDAVISDNRVLNVLMHNQDGHYWNLGSGKHWVDGEAHPVFIDWGASLRPGTKVSLTEYHAYGNSSPVDTVSRKTFEALQRLKAEDFRGMVDSNILSWDEAHQILGRRDGIVAYFKGIQEQEVKLGGKKAEQSTILGEALKSHAAGEQARAKPVSPLADPNRVQSQRELVTAALERAPAEFQFVKLQDPNKEPVKMVKMSDLGYPKDKEVKIESAHGGVQVKPAGSDAFLVFDKDKKGYAMVAAGADGNPFGHAPRDFSEGSSVRHSLVGTDEKTILTEASKGPAVYSSKDLYDYWAKNSEKLQPKLASLYDTQTAQALVTKLQAKLGKEFLPLLIEPGVADRLDQFLAFSEKQPDLKKLSPLELRNRFADSLGTVTVYRGVGVQPSEVPAMKKNGLTSAGFASDFSKGDRSGISTYFGSVLLDDPQVRSFSDTIAMVRAPDKTDPPLGLIAVTDYHEVAEGVGAYYGKTARKNAKLEVLKMEVPAIQVLSTGGIIHHKWDNSFGASMRFWNPSTGQFVRDVPWTDKGLERYVQGLIDPSWIKSVETIEAPKSMWEDGNLNFDVFNWEKINLDAKKNAGSKAGGIPVSPNDFFSVLRTDPSTILDQEKLQNFLKTKAGPDFKKQLLQDLTMGAPNAELGDNDKEIAIYKKVSQFQDRMRAAPGFEKTALLLATDPDAAVKYEAISQYSNLVKSPSPEFQDALRGMLKNENESAHVRLLAADQLTADGASAPLRTLTGLDADTFFPLVQKVCAETRENLQCADMLDRVAKADPGAVQSPRAAELIQFLRKSNDEDTVEVLSQIPTDMAEATRHSLVSVVKPAVVEGQPVYSTEALRKLDQSKPAVAAAIRYRDSGADQLALARRRYFAETGSFQALEKANQRFGHLESFVPGTSEAARRIGYLRQEENYLARAAEKARADNDLSRAAELDRQRAGMAAQLLAETKARAEAFSSAADRNKLRQDARHGEVSSLISDDGFAAYQSYFPGRTLQEVAADPVESQLLAALKKKEIELSLRAEHEERAILAKSFTARDNAASEKMANDLVEARSKTFAELKTALQRRGWSQKEVADCFERETCSPINKILPAKTAAREDELSPLARQVIMESEVAKGEEKTVAEAKAIVKDTRESIPGDSVFNSTMEDLRKKESALQAEAKKLAKRRQTEPENSSLKKASADLGGAQGSIAARIGKLTLNRDTLKAARPLSAAENSLNDAAVKAVMTFLANSDQEALSKIHPALANLSQKGVRKGEDRLQKYLEFKRIVGGMSPADRAKVFAEVKSAAKGKEGLNAASNDLQAIAKAITRSDELAAATGTEDAKVTRAVYRDAKISPEGQALADAIGATKAGAVSPLERHAVAAAETKKIEAELKANPEKRWDDALRDIADEE